MAVLSADQIGTLSGLLGRAFTQIELAPVVQVALEAPLANLVSINQPFPGIVFELVNWVDRRNRPAVIALLQGVVTARAGDTEIWAFCDEIFPGEIKRLDSGVLVDRVNRGIAALVTLKHLPIVQSTVGQFRADFEAVSRQIQILKKYKSLHDSLHRLQLKMGTIQATVDAAKKDARAARSLALHAIELKPLAQKARQQTQGLPGAQNELAWIDEFDDCLSAMNLASRQAANLEELAADLGRLLSEAPRINALLASVASTLPLDNLVQAMATIATHIHDTSTSDDEAAKLITADLTVLGLLQPQLADLVSQHFEWQWMDKELAAAALLSGLSPVARMPKKKWPQFKARFVRLCDEHPQDGWSKDLTDRLLLWEKSLLSSPPTTDEIDVSDSAFDEFHSASGMRFFEVDDELNTLCGRLTELAAPLNALLLVIKS